MCHHTEASLSRATILMPAMLRTSWIASSDGHRQELAAHERRTQDRRAVAVGDPEVRQDRRDDRRVDEAGGGEIDAGHDGDLAGQVEPGRPPAPVLVLHPARPVVEAAGRRVGRRDLGHGGGDHQGEDRDERPADGAGGGAAPGEAVVEKDHRAGEDRDDREADGEVGEPAHGPEELLGIAQAMQVVNVLLDPLLARCLLLSHSDLLGNGLERLSRPARAGRRSSPGNIPVRAAGNVPVSHAQTGYTANVGTVPPAAMALAGRSRRRRSPASVRAGAAPKG